MRKPLAVFIAVIIVAAVLALAVQVVADLVACGVEIAVALYVILADRVEAVVTLVCLQAAVLVAVALSVGHIAQLLARKLKLPE